MTAADPLAGVTDQTHPHLAGLSDATRRAILVDAAAVATTAPPPSRALIETLRGILRESPIRAGEHAA